MEIYYNKGNKGGFYMVNLNFEPFFESTDTKYYDSRYIITILETILGDRLEEIKKKVNSTQVVVSKEQITEYLEKTFEKEDPELKKRIESPKPKRSGNIVEWTIEDMKASSQELVDDLSAGRYYFEPYTLEYFKKYSNIVRNKALLLLDMIEKIGKKDCMSIQDLMKELDIQLDENGNVLKEDIIRLITPVVYNINKLNEKVTEANDLSTYLTFKMSKHSLYRDGWSEREIYPTESLQIKNLYYDYMKDNVPLSNNQRRKLEQQQRRSMKIFAKILLD